MRPVFHLPFAAICTVASFAAPARAQDAQKLYQTYKDATTKVKALTYKAEVKPVEGAANAPGAAPTVSGTVTMTTDLTERPDLRGKFIVKAEMTKPGETEPTRYEIAFDGKAIRNVVHKDKTVEEMKAEGNEMIPFFSEPMMLLAYNYWHDEDDMGAPSKITHAGQDEVGGVKCDILVVERTFELPSMEDEGEAAPAGAKTQKQTFKTRLHVGAEDHLLRRSEYQSDPSKEEYSMSISFTDVDAKPTLQPAVFELKTPEGYAVKEITADDMTPDEPEAKFKVGDVAADFTLKDGEGKEHKLSEFKGKVVLIDFWATWCPPCRLAMPGLQKLQDKFKDKNVVVMGVSIDDNGADAVKYMKKNNLTYLGLVDGQPVAQVYGVSSIPQFFIIGVDGKVIHYGLGYDPANDDAFAAVIQKHLDEQPKR